MNAIDFLTQQHQIFRDLFQQIEEAPDFKAKKALALKLRVLFNIHANLEESLLYPLCQSLPETRKMTLESLEEHHEIHQLLHELDQRAQLDRWEAVIDVIEDFNEHHVREEETDLFPKIAAMFDAAILDRMGQEMALRSSQAEAGTVLTTG